MCTAVLVSGCKALHVGWAAMCFGVHSMHVRLHCTMYVGWAAWGAQLHSTHAHDVDVVCVHVDKKHAPPPLSQCKQFSEII